MNSWWELGEHGGFQADKMEVWRLTCAFCGEKGNFGLAYRAEKKKANGNKVLNFDLYQCHNCMGFVHVLWSRAEYGARALYDFQVLPYPLKEKPEASEDWPKGMQRFWVQAHHSLANENWDAANVMARSALQFVVRERGAEGSGLKAQIDDLVTKGVLHPLMKDWASEVRLLANESAHPDPKDDVEVEPADARDIIHFLDMLLFYLYDLPKQIEDFRNRDRASSTV